jgi:hypothetical protein
MPRSLHSCFNMIEDTLEILCDDDSAEIRRQGGEIHARLTSAGPTTSSASASTSTSWTSPARVSSGRRDQPAFLCAEHLENF